MRSAASTEEITASTASSISTIWPFLIPLDGREDAPIIFIVVSRVVGSRATCEIKVATLVDPSSIAATIRDFVIS